MSIRIRLMIGSLLFLILILFSSGWSIYSYRQSRHDAITMNLTGRQRSLTLKLTKEALEYYIKPNDSTLQQIHQSQVLLANGHDALRNGGKIAMLFDGTNVVELPKPDFGQMAEKLDDAKPFLDKLLGALSKLPEQAAKGDKAALNDIIDTAPIYVSKIGAALGTAQEEIEHKATGLERFHILFLVLGLGLVGATLWVGNSIGNALKALAMAADKISAGEVTEAFIINDSTEIGILAQSFERMRVSIQKMIEKME